MRRAGRILIGAGCVLLLMISWVIIAGSKSNAQKQLDLMRQAAELTGKGIYIHAVPLLEEAAGYNAAHTLTAETELKIAYLALIGNKGIGGKYTGLLEKQMSRRDVLPEVFAEAAYYYIGKSKIPEALSVLKAGIEKTGSDQLISIYENNRYVFITNRMSYDSVTAISGSTIQVQKDGLWGIARSDGSPLIPCEYDKISTFSVDRAIVRKNGEIYAVDKNNDRTALMEADATDFGNYADNRIPVLISGSWQRTTGDFEIGAMGFEQMGMYSNGYAAAKEQGRWGVIGLSAKWLIPAEYDEIIQDELGRCFGQGAVFARTGAQVFLIVEGTAVGEPYEDARPFSGEGFAAVKRNGKWGFVDNSGTLRIDFIYNDALSFGQHLAAVKQGELWGYISHTGNIVIEPVFLEAKSFSYGSAPVRTERGWQFITLLEYRKEVSL